MYYMVVEHKPKSSNTDQTMKEPTTPLISSIDVLSLSPTKIYLILNPILLEF